MGDVVRHVDQFEGSELLCVASLNALRDTNHGYPRQAVRIDGMVGMLATHAAGPLNFVGMCEVQGTAGDNPARKIARGLDLPRSMFVPYEDPSYKAGMAVAYDDRFTGVDVVELDPDHKRRVAVVAYNDDEAVAAVHPTHNILVGPSYRRRQMDAFLKYMAEFKKAVVTGDMNALPDQESRLMLEDAGFVSVLGSLELHPSTFPTDFRTCDIGAPALVKPFIRLGLCLLGGVPIDDICVRGGHKTHEAGIVDTPDARRWSDHFAVSAAIEWIDTPNHQAAADNPGPVRSNPPPRMQPRRPIAPYQRPLDWPRG